MSGRSFNYHGGNRIEKVKNPKNKFITTVPDFGLILTNPNFPELIMSQLLKNKSRLFLDEALKHDIKLEKCHKMFIEKIQRASIEDEELIDILRYIIKKIKFENDKDVVDAILRSGMVPLLKALIGDLRFDMSINGERFIGDIVKSVIQWNMTEKTKYFKIFLCMKREDNWVHILRLAIQYRCEDLVKFALPRTKSFMYDSFGQSINVLSFLKTERSADKAIAQRFFSDVLSVTIVDMWNKGHNPFFDNNSLNKDSEIGCDETAENSYIVETKLKLETEFAG